MAREQLRRPDVAGRLECRFDPVFATVLSLREKQVQQSYRPVIGIHKWFARRPGSVFRSLLLSEFDHEPLNAGYLKAHKLRGVIADPFMGGGTPLLEANRLGFDIVGADISPIAWWIVNESLAPVDTALLSSEADRIASVVDEKIGHLYRTECTTCHRDAPVKYFIWVKTLDCPNCHAKNDLFPGYLLAEAVRHPRHVVACRSCGHLNEYDAVPTDATPATCARCEASVTTSGTAKSGRITCADCSEPYRYPRASDGPPRHRLWAIEYNCPDCYSSHKGRMFKEPDAKDLERSTRATSMLSEAHSLPIPDDLIPAGDETDRLHRWGYRRYRDMFNDRQLLGLGTLLQAISDEPDGRIRDALATVFSDFLRYQNMLCRYDTYALKCQDIFSVHGFPVGLVQCENSLLGIPGVGSGSFRHFIQKYVRAKDYCASPFEVSWARGKKEVVPTPGETIEASVTPSAVRGQKSARLFCGPAQYVPVTKNSLDGVFTDPPYFDNVQYAELMDFCFVWLRLALASRHPEFAKSTTRSADELTGNNTLSRGLPEFADGISAVFRRFAAGLKPSSPFVFTYHHNDPTAYAPLVVGILDAGLSCEAVFPVAAEMSASMHISGTGSSILDSVFICRRTGRKAQLRLASGIGTELANDAQAMRRAGVRITAGDLRCLLAGRIAAAAVVRLASDWDSERPVVHRLEAVTATLDCIRSELNPEALIEEVLGAGA